MPASRGRASLLSILCPCCVIILTASLAGPCSCSAAEPTPVGLTLPHLEFGSTTSYLLPSGQPWKPGETTLVTMLMVGQPLAVQVSLVQENLVLHPPSLNLLYKCNASSDGANFSSIRLTTNGSRSLKPSVTYCKPSRPFIVAAQPDDIHGYNVTLSGPNGVPFGQALRHMLEFRLEVVYAEGSLQSQSLFVYNFDALAKLNPAPKSHLGVPFTRYILTEEAVQFLSTLVGKQKQSIESIQFLEKQFLQVYHDAPLYIRGTIAITVIIRANSKCTDELKTGFTDLVISTGDSHAAIQSTFTDNTEISLHLPTGKLVFSGHGVSTQRSSISSKYAKSDLQICIRVSANTPVWNYHLTLPVTETLKGPLTAKDSFPLDGICNAVIGKYEWRILTQGSQDVILMNPIICTKAGSTHVATVYFQKRECINFISTGSVQQWQPCGRYEIARLGGAIRIAGPLDQSHAGNYRFVRGGISFTYVISVVSFPLFQTTLPHWTFANLDTQVHLNCTANHDGMSHVMLEPLFRVFERFRLPTWRTLSLDEFALEVLHLAPRSITRRTSKTATSNSMLITMPHVSSQWQTWILVYTCRATVVNEDVGKLGLSSYQADTSTDVVYFGSRLSPLGAAVGIHARPDLVFAAAASAAAVVMLLWPL